MSWWRKSWPKEGYTWQFSEVWIPAKRRPRMYFSWRSSMEATKIFSNSEMLRPKLVEYNLLNILTVFYILYKFYLKDYSYPIFLIFILFWMANIYFKIFSGIELFILIIYNIKFVNIFYDLTNELFNKN